MPMGIVNSIEFDSELNNSNSSKSSQDSVPSVQSNKIKSIPNPSPSPSPDKSVGRGKNNVEVPNTLRNLIGQESIENGRDSALALAKNFGISPSSVSAYTNGSTSTATYDKTPNKPTIDGVKNRITTKAKKRLLMALNHITEDKLEVAPLKTLSGVAKDMSAIVKNMEPESVKSNESSSGPTFVFYSPQLKDESKYDIITVKE